MPPSFNNTCAIIITYHPDAQFSERLEKVLAQFSLIIIVDNASAEPAAEMLRNLSAFPNIRLLHNSTNLGIAAALNQGMELALQIGFEWGLTLDQDTLVHGDIRETLSTMIVNCGIENVIIGANYWNTNRQSNFIKCNDGKIYLERKTLITSGTLMSLTFAKRIGGFREDYFIDSVDHEFCLRARTLGCKVLISCKPLMQHSIGTANEAGWISKISSFNHSSVRKYFIARNAMATAKGYFFQEPLWAMRQACRLMFDFVSILFFEENKKEKTHAFITGMAHGIIGKMGPIEQAWPNGTY